MEGPPFFIVGSARSGTTLLRMLFNAHRDVAVPPESRFIVEFYKDGGIVDVGSFLADLAGHARFQNWDLPIETIREELPGRTAGYVEAIEGVYRAYTRTHGKKRWGDKTPRYIEHMPLLSRLWPQARFIHIIRDGRDVALSYADVPFGPKTVAKAAQLWARRVAVGTRDGRALGGDRYMEIHYEELVGHLEPTAKDLCSFLNLDFDPQMLEYTERARSDVLPTAARYNPHLTQKPISRVRCWERDMPEDQVEIFEAVAGDVLSELDYPRRYPTPDAGARAVARLSLAGLPLARLRSTRTTD